MWRQLLTYLYIRKRDRNDPRNVNVWLMHGMNRISIFVFVVALVVMFIRIFLR